MYKINISYLNFIQIDDEEGQEGRFDPQEDGQDDQQDDMGAVQENPLEEVQEGEVDPQEDGQDDQQDDKATVK